jgi:hypothetical protein
MKQTILTLLLTLFAVGTWAADAKIIVWQKDGNTTEILFNEMPEFLYADGNVSVQNGGTTVSWPLANLEKFTFEDVAPSVPTVPTGVKEVQKPKLDIMKGCAVYDLSGRLVKEQIRSLSELPKGTYILKDGSVTTKVVKR